KATGGVRAQFGTDINIWMSLYSIDFFKNCNFDPGYDPKGYLFLATNKSQLSALSAGVERQKSLGYDSVQIIDVESIKKMVPGLKCDDLIGGSFGPRDGFIDPPKRQIVWARTRVPLPPDLPMVIEMGSGFHFRPTSEFGVHQPVTAGGSDDSCNVLLAYPDPDETPSFSTEFEIDFIDKVCGR